MPFLSNIYKKRLLKKGVFIMEKTISQEDRIRRAEEIYYRRKNNLNIPKTATVNLNPPKKYKVLKKIVIQLIICIAIYFGIYGLQTKTDSFSIDSIKSTEYFDFKIFKI